MGYHTGSDIPNYWTYARNFVLQDHMFEPNASWSLPAHLFMVSEWSASCTQHNDPQSATTRCRPPGPEPANGNPTQVRPGRDAPIYAWTDLTYLLHEHHVSWGYYVVAGHRARLPEHDAAAAASPVTQNAADARASGTRCRTSTPCSNDHQLGNIQSVSTASTRAAQAGTLPAVSWVVPSGDVSEHPPAPISAGQSYVTSLVNAVMRGPDWSSTAIFLAWDDWGGFYDNVAPPTVDENGYGLRVPGHRDQPVRQARLHRPPDA